jgi:hypothetical protein
MDIIRKTRGEVGLIDWCKSVRLALLHSLSGEFPSKIVAGIPLTKEGIPKIIGISKEELMNNSTLLRLLLTILYSTRALHAGKKPNIHPISDPSSVTDIPDLSEYVVDFWRSLGYRPSREVLPRGIRFKKYHMTTKAGPNGQAVWTSMVDLKLVLTNSRLVECLKVIGGPKLAKILSTFESLDLSLLPKTLFPSEGTTLRRLSWFPDKESKTRVIAILDFWSQTALRPFHDYLFRVLRKIPQDCTFNQGSFLDKVKGWDKFYSIDLTAATDRFPIKVISLVLKGLLPDYFVTAWEYIMIGIPFDFQGNKVSYSVGNPMGAYSSWNSFTVAHHYIIYWCCRKLKMDWRTSKYVILGDDVLIGDHNLAIMYKEIIHLLGVEISSIKTHESSKLLEFAKRLILNGIEVTPFPISSLCETSKRSYLLTNTLTEETRRGWNWILGIPLTTEAFYRTVLSYNATRGAKCREKSYLSELMVQTIRGDLPAHDALNSIVRRYNLPLPNINDYQGISILSGTALSIFVESNPLDFKTGKPLGLLAEQLVCEITGLFETSVGETAFTLPSMVPILNLYGQVEEAYLKIMREAYLIDTIGKGEWPVHLRTLALPFSDDIFKERTSHTIIRVGALIGEKVLENLRALRPSDLS